MIKRCLGTLLLTVGLGSAQTVNVVTPLPVCSVTQTAACLLTPQDYQAFGQKLSPTSSIPWAQLVGVPVATNLIDGILRHQDFQAFAGRQLNLGFTPENIANKTKPGGYAGLGSDGFVLAAELPASIAGAQGPPGPTGPQGPIGATGPIGPAGVTGAAGQPGANGAPGAPGSQGIQGPAGANGAQGLAGPIGPSGSAGSPGPIGPQGPVGTAANTLVAADGTALSITGATGPVPLGGCAFSSTDQMLHCQDTLGNEGTMIKTGTPASSDPCAPPQVMQDGVNIYVCVAPSQWKKVALTTY